MTYIMGKEPLSDMTPQDIQNHFSGTLTEKELATAFALSSNEFWWVEDNVYDYEEGTLEHKRQNELPTNGAVLWSTMKNRYLKF